MNMKDLKPGELAVIPGFLMTSPYGGGLTWNVTELEENGYMTVSPLALNFQVPADFDPVRAEVSGLDRQMSKAADAYHQTIGALKERKQALLQITHTVGETEVITQEEIDAAPLYNFKDIGDDIPF